MSGLKAGFARVDVTPSMGYPIEGYYHTRYADGVLDNLYVTAVAFDDGEKKAVVMSLDAIGMHQRWVDPIREMVAKKIGTETEGIYIACTHTHLGLGFSRLISDNEDGDFARKTYEIVKDKICDAAILAVNDLKPAKLYYTRGVAEDVSFIRRFRMQDGTACTNPGDNAPFVVEPLDKVDDTVQHLIIKREGGYDIGIVNFQVHADVIGGSTLSADFPHFVRDTYEKILDNTRCMYLNGAEGDSNHTDIRLPNGHIMKKSYERARYMGRKIAMAAIADYEMAIPLDGTEIKFGQKNIMVKLNKGTDKEVEAALDMKKVYAEKGDQAAIEYVGKKYNLPLVGKNPWNKPAGDEFRRLNRIAALVNEPDEAEVHLTAVSVGDVVFAGLPGEPFTEVGRQIKEQSKFALTIPTCCSNGYEGYYPTEKAFSEGGYEAITARYSCGTAEKLIETSVELVNSFKK